MNNTSCCLSTAYLAPVHYFSKIAQTQEIILEQHEHYLKQTYRNRCNIYAANGVMALTIPVIKNHGTKMPIRDVRIDYATNWQHLHWHAIISSYKASPFFEYYADDFYPYYEQKEIFLFDRNEKILRRILELLGIHVKIGYTERFAPHYPNNDYRYTITPKTQTTLIDTNFKPQNYYQVFAFQHGFMANLSILDLLCNEGPNSLNILQDCCIK